MNDNEVNELVKKISLEFFQRSFKHKASFNPRLRAIGGRYLVKSHNIELNKKSYELYGMDELIRVIKHELCHYHLHIQGEGYMHKDISFKKLLSKVDGAKYSKTLTKNKKRPFLYKLVCKKCNQEYYRKRKVDIKKYRCSKCFGYLELLYLEEINIDN